jgi:hypothetical protein
MSEDHPHVFLNYVETSQERERVLALLHPEVRAVVEQYMADHPAISAKKAINATAAFGKLIGGSPSTICEWPISASTPHSACGE